MRNAFYWQKDIVHTQEIIESGHVYTGPHQQIIAIIGPSDHYLKTFREEYSSKLAAEKNFQISILRFSSFSRDKNTMDYSKLCHIEGKGQYKNIFDRATCKEEL